MDLTESDNSPQQPRARRRSAAAGASHMDSVPPAEVEAQEAHVAQRERPTAPAAPLQFLGISISGYPVAAWDGLQPTRRTTTEPCNENPDSQCVQKYHATRTPTRTANTRLTGGLEEACCGVISLEASLDQPPL